MAARLVIAGTHSGVGKTTVTVGLIAALRRRGLAAQPFKVGPDYIDPTYHTLAAGRPCRNLDTWMVPAERVRALFAHAVGDADIAVVEGVMGLYDGAGYDSDAGSTAEVAKLLGAPVILVLDAAKVARSAAAVALGYLRFDNATSIVGFIINNAANENHGRGIAGAVQHATGLPVLGWLPREALLRVPERHLGLIPTNEPGRWSEFVEAAGECMARYVDIDRVLQVGQHFPCVSLGETRMHQPAANAARLANRPVIAVARDEAFHFTYEDNLHLLRAAGAEISFFSPLQDSMLPLGTAGIILSGGFPEVFADRLAANGALHAEIRAAQRRHLPIYAECGGLMYLTESIIDQSAKAHAMVGLLPGQCVMDRLTLGYRIARSAGDSWLLRDGEEIRGHEFHHSTWENRPHELPPAYLLLPRSGEGKRRPEGARLGSLLASYVHIHLATKPGLAERFVAACRRAAGGDL